MNIFVISLKAQKTRRDRIIDEMGKYNIEFSFFDAIDGKVGHHVIDDYNYKKCLWLTSGKMPTKGELGCYASHYMLWLHCVEINKPIVVFEDDVIAKPNSKCMIDLLSKEIDKYGFIRLEPPIRGKLYDVKKNNHYCLSLMEDNFGGARGYMISPKAASRLIKHRWCNPVDCFIGLPYIHGMDSFVVSPSIIEHNENIPTTVQIGFSKTKWYRKPSREIYTAYKKIRRKLHFHIRKACWEKKSSQQA